MLNQQYHLKREERFELPLNVPWEFVETFRAQIEKNHGQTLERLAERGGLAPTELWLAAHGHTLFRVKITDLEAITWLWRACEP